MTTSAVVSSCPQIIAQSDKIILPGVGHFATAMANLERLDITEPLTVAVLGKRKPVLGICLGMELMANNSEEGGVRGLGWLDAVSVKFRPTDTDRYKVPHMGWNQISVKKKSALLEGVPDAAEYYFAHSYYLQLNDETCLLSKTEYGIEFASAVERDNVFGVQFHPEKSHDAGRLLLENFIAM